MSIKIRLSRGGRKKLPFYKIVVANSTAPRDGKFIEKLGTYNPLLASDNTERLVINKERVEYWLSTGATPSERVSLFLNQLGVKGAEKYKPDFEPRKAGHGAKKKAQELAAKALEAEAKRKEEEEAAKAAEKAAKEEEAAAKAQAKEAKTEEVATTETKEEAPQA